MQFKFDDNLDYQTGAVKSITGLFIDFGDFAEYFEEYDSEIKGNIPEDEELDEEWLLENLQAVQDEFNERMDANNTPTMKITPSTHLEMESGIMLEGVSNDGFQYPSFSIEMETGTGKTYVYLKTLYELHQKYKFKKFIIVVPSIAIFQGVKEAFNSSRDHFKSIYGNHPFVLRPYEGGKIETIKTYATDSEPEILLMTLASFNSKGNKIYQTSESIPDGILPYQYIQKTRPIVIMDEPQNMGSQISKDAIRTLKPLFSIRFSATHRTDDCPNLTYRLTPLEAFRRNLVKKIQVIGITEEETGGKQMMSLKEVKGKGRTAKATIVCYKEENGVRKLEEITLKQDDELQRKTRLEEHLGFKVTNIGSESGNEFIEFENTIRLDFNGGDGVSRPNIFRYQIRQTLQEHFERQEKLEKENIKVISLFFIDRVANYIGNGSEEGIIKRIFNEEFRLLREKSTRYKNCSPEEVQLSYFASYRKGKKGKEEDIYLDKEASDAKGRAAEKEQFELIMNRKKELLSFNDKHAFIFAHSALKEGWDNPNVFQICTLNQTVSVVKKRQEIGRGLRLAVNQDGDRIFDDQINVLTVIANEKYETFANSLQSEYSTNEGGAPPPPKPKRAPAIRKDEIYTSEDFKGFWEKLIKKTEYNINIDTEKLLNEIKSEIEAKTFPDPKVVISKGDFTITQFIFKIREFKRDGRVELEILQEESNKSRDGIFKNVRILNVEEGDNISTRRYLDDTRLRGFEVHSIDPHKSNPEVVFKNGERITKFKELVYEVSDNRNVQSRETEGNHDRFKVFNVIDKLEKATSLTKATCFKIFDAIPSDKANKVFRNPEGFTNKLIEITKNCLGNHISENVEFTVTDDSIERDLEELFPPEMEYVQNEIIATPNGGLYTNTQKDSDIENHFVVEKLEKDENVVFYFKFPSKYKIDFPKIIGNYNPDWAIVRKTEDGGHKVELVRETKGNADIERLRFSHEIRKVKVAQRHFKALNLDYKVIKGDEEDWYAPI